MVDGEFKQVKAELTSIMCNTAPAKEHVVEAECGICMIKE